MISKLHEDRRHFVDLMVQEKNEIVRSAIIRGFNSILDELDQLNQ